RMLHRSMLVNAGFDVLGASDGLQALQALGNNAVDLVLTDIEMPNMDGLALIRRIRQSPAWRHLPIIVVSQYGRREDLEKGAEAGADRYVVKSQLDASRLVAMISELMD
ncbi:MAG: response regulator, partial [Vicinamibacteria bacterium]